MFKWLRNTFKGKQLLEVATSAWEDTTFKILHELKYNRSPLTLMIPGEKQLYATFILDIDPKKQIMVLDELFPQEGNQLAKQGSTVTIKGRHQGVHVNFECAVEGTISKHGLDGLLIHFPTGLEYMQRRDAFRVCPPGKHAYKCHFELEAKERVEASVEDISLTGMRMTIEDNIVAALKPKMTVLDAEIVLPSHETIKTGLKLCHISYNPDDDVTVLGCEFKCSSADSQRQINHCVTDLQRLINYQTLAEQESGRNVS